jgi:hypothetical protein
MQYETHNTAGLLVEMSIDNLELVNKIQNQ